MNKALGYGIAASFFFAFTFIFNRSMNLAGGNWMWSASLRYFFTLPILYGIVAGQKGQKQMFSSIRTDKRSWIIWSTVGFGLFYAPLSLASVYGESWLVASTWEITIVAGALMTPLLGKRISGQEGSRRLQALPLKVILCSLVVLTGVFLLQIPEKGRTVGGSAAACLIPILIAAFAYPLGNRKMMEVCGGRLNTPQRVLGMTICSMPFWFLLAAAALISYGPPTLGQIGQSLIVACFSGVAATLLFFKATDMVKDNPRQLAVIEATQAGEVIFTLLGGICLLGDQMPGWTGAIGIGFIVAGMILNSMAARE